MNKKEIAMLFLTLATSGKVREAYDIYVHHDFHHHNPYFHGDRESFLLGMEEGFVKFPHKTYEVIRALEEGDLVAVHGRVRLAPDMSEISLVHIFRFDEELIIEEWEVAQGAPQGSPNENGIF